MVARLVEATDTIEVKQTTLLVYGQPGARKSSLTQTADKPFTFACDPGIYRAFGRKASMLFDTWADILQFDQDADLMRHGKPVNTPLAKDEYDRYIKALEMYLAAKTVVIDTVGFLLDRMSDVIANENQKNRNPMGGLSLQGFGVLKQRFYQFAAPWKARGQDVVLTCHEKENKKRNGDQPYYQPDIVGASYNTIMNHADGVGYTHFDNGQRCIDWNPNDGFMAKTPPCNWKQMILPDFAKEPDFLAKLITQAKESMGRISGESAKLAQEVEKWQSRINEAATIADVNLLLPEAAPLSEQLKRPVWALFQQRASRGGWEFDKAAKQFTAKASSPQSPPPPPPTPPPAGEAAADSSTSYPENPDADVPAGNLFKPEEAKPEPRKTRGKKAGAA